MDFILKWFCNEWKSNNHTPTTIDDDDALIRKFKWWHVIWYLFYILLPFIALASVLTIVPWLAAAAAGHGPHPWRYVLSQTTPKWDLIELFSAPHYQPYELYTWLYSYSDISTPTSLLSSEAAFIGTPDSYSMEWDCRVESRERRWSLNLFERWLIKRRALFVRILVAVEHNGDFFVLFDLLGSCSCIVRRRAIVAIGVVCRCW